MHFAYRIVFSLISVAVLAAGAAAGQSLTRGVASLGTIRGNAAAVEEIDALHLNPANLLRGTGSRFTLSLGRLSVFAGGDLLQFDHYDRVFSAGASLDAGQAAALLDSWFGTRESGEIRWVGASAEVAPLAVTYRQQSWALGFGVRGRLASQTGISRGIFDLLLIGNEEERALPVHARVGAVSMVDFTFAFSRRIPRYRLTVGLAPKLVLGTDYMDGRLESTLTLANGGFHHLYSYSALVAGRTSRGAIDRIDFIGEHPDVEAAIGRPLSSIAGRGFGVDVGATYQATPTLAVAVSITDLGSVRWQRDALHAVSAGADFHVDDFLLDLNRIDGEFEGNIGTYFQHVLDSLVQAAYGETVKTPGSFSKALPAAFHLGAAWDRLGGRATLTGGMTAALNGAPGNLARSPMLHFGAAYRVGNRYAIPLRSGIVVAGHGAVGLSFGFGFHTPHYSLDLGVFGTPYSNTFGRGARYAVGLSLATFRF